MTIISSHLQAVNKRISAACLKAGRSQRAVRLIAVSKKAPVSAIQEAVHCGQLSFAENIVQEAMCKMDEISGKKCSDMRTDLIEWHYIGALQSNKSRLVAEHFTWIHSVERLKTALRLSDHRPPQLPPLQICIQVNISREQSKGGCLPEQAVKLAQDVDQLPRLQLRGFMAIPEPVARRNDPHAPFIALRDLMHTANRLGHLKMDTLSMGMSDDLEEAIAAGATMIRIGSAIFGSR